MNRLLVTDRGGSSEGFSGLPPRHCCLLLLLFSQKWQMPLMTAMEAGYFTAVVEGSTTAGSTMVGAFPSRVRDRGDIYAPYWWVYGYPYSYYGYYDNYPDNGYYGYDPSCSYYGTCPNHGYGAHPSGRQTWYYCSDPAGYYPHVTECKIGWLPVPAS
jgi:hypothetical protein